MLTPFSLLLVLLGPVASFVGFQGSHLILTAFLEKGGRGEARGEAQLPAVRVATTADSDARAWVCLPGRRASTSEPPTG